MKALRAVLSFGVGVFLAWKSQLKNQFSDFFLIVTRAVLGTFSVTFTGEDSAPMRFVTKRYFDAAYNFTFY